MSKRVRPARWSTKPARRERWRMGGYRVSAPDTADVPPGELEFESGGDYAALGPNVLVRLWTTILGRRS
ncbi:MAG: hypothetical protein KUG77_05500 [Nannocystaceae bacterium]|nr:hypothetical protein [Nannocystaceae bacterium]